MLIIIRKKLITVRNEVAKVMFLQACVCPRGGGGCLTRYTPLGPGTPPCDQVHPPGRYTPLDQVSPPPTRTRYTPWAGTPPRTRYPPPQDQVHPTPLGRYLPRDTATAADGMHPTGMSHDEDERHGV